MENRVENENLENEPSNENWKSKVTIKLRSPVKFKVFLRNTQHWKKVRRSLLAVVLISLASCLTYFAYVRGYAEGLKKSRAIDNGSRTSDTRLFRFPSLLEILITEFLIVGTFVLYFFGYLPGEWVHDPSRQRDADFSLFVSANEYILLDLDYEITRRPQNFRRLLNFLINDIRNDRNRNGFIFRPD